MKKATLITVLAFAISAAAVFANYGWTNPANYGW
jgi:hypothetical protein